MALFNKNPNESAYIGGKKHWTDVIKNSGNGSLLIWKQPEEDFNTNSTLIVMPGEQAIFIKGGTVEQVFENGTYKLSSENYPFISRLRNAFSGGISTFNCVVYFVKKADSKEIRWGTETPIQVRDKMYNIRTSAKVRGAYKVRIVNPVKFLEKMVGSNVNYQAQADLSQYFSSEFQGKIKSAVSKFLNALEQELIGIDAYMDELSEKIEPYIDEALEDYGLKCVRFSLAGLDIDISKYDVIDKAQLGQIAKIKGAQGDRGVMDILGPDWDKQQAVNIIGKVASTPSSGGLASLGAGLGLGMATTGVFGSMAKQVFPNAPGGSANTAGGQQPVNAPAAGNQQQTAASREEDPIEVLGKLKKMLDAGLIDQSDFDAKKKDILSKM